ncbi:MAG: pyruvate kinase [Filifactoraceae bacterium]
MDKKTKIVCTIGPASESVEVLKELIDNGMNVARLNFSHGSHEEHKVRIDSIKEARIIKNQPIALLLDTKGPEIRTGLFDQPEVKLEEGQKFIITMEDIVGNNERCTVSYKELKDDVSAGNTILIDDGLIELRVLEVIENEIITRVENTGIVKNNKGVNVPNVKINLPAVTDKDRADIIFGIENDIDFIAASFVRKASDVLEVRKVLEENNAEHIQIIAKIENQEGVDNIDEILKVADGIMVARGDLGVEIPTEEIPIVQKLLIKKCNELSKPVITATQMLDSMIRNPRPTRAEVTDVANAIYDGTDAIMLSGETAAGKYPIESVITMSNIAKRTEEELDYSAILRSKVELRTVNITNAISHATCTTAVDVGAKAIITSTSSGYTARMVSSYRPKAPIIASVSSERVMRQMSLIWSVKSLLTPVVNNTDDLIEVAVSNSIKEELIKSGDIVVITAGVPVGKTGTTNLIKVHMVTDVVARGIGIGNKSISGKVRICSENLIDIEEGEILVAKYTGPETVGLIQKAAALVVEEGGLTSHAAIVGVSLGKTVIVGASDITTMVEDGQLITIDPLKGYIYSGIVGMV